MHASANGHCVISFLTLCLVFFFFNCRAYEQLNVKHEPLQLIQPQFETPLPVLQPAVSNLADTGPGESLFHVSYGHTVHCFCFSFKRKRERNTDIATHLPLKK